MDFEIAQGADLVDDPDRAAAANGDFEAMVRVFRPKIFRFILASLRDDDAADTLAQDCFLRAFRAWPTFRGECSLDTWLMRIAVNLVRDHVRNRRLQFWKRTRQNAATLELAHNQIAGPELTPEARMLLREQVNAVWRAAATLPVKQRGVFLLRFIEEMDLLEIASVMGMKEGTVKAHLFSALRNVRRQIGAAV